MPTPTRTPTETRTAITSPTFTPTHTATPISALIPAGQTWRFYYFAGAQRIAMRYKDSYGYNVEGYLLSDHLGSTYKTISNTGVQAGELRYREASCKDYAFGETRLSSGTTPTDYRYTGQLSQMTDTGLYYYGARWYDPALGRFTQPDTMVPLESQGIQAWDRYAYVNNSPINTIDPSGHKACDDLDKNGQCITFPDLPTPIPPGPTNNQEPNLLSDDAMQIISYSSENGLCIFGGCLGGTSYSNWWHEMYLPAALDFYQSGYFSDLVFLWGGAGSTSAPSIYSTGGVEEIVFLDDGTRATYNYGGHGNAVGVGASGVAYIGFAANVQTPEDYTGVSSAMGITASIPEGGLSISYFWNGNYAPLTPGIVQGIQVGYAPGAQISGWWSNVVYNRTWTSK